MPITVRVDTSKIAPSIRKASSNALAILTQQVVKDSNMYVPVDTGNLRNSSLRASDFSNGKAIWDTKYAMRLYYGVSFHFSHDVNPLAQAMWFDKAASVHSNEWADVAQRAVEKGL